MTRVLFYTDITDKQQALLVLVQKALAKKHLITIITAGEEAAIKHSEYLWQTEKSNFLPNVLASHAMVQETPIVFDWEENRLCQDDILINLSQKQLTVFSRFRQLVELVGVDEQDKILARERYKFYRDRGYEIKHFDQQSLMH